ncbi:succinyl-diaminopimelate desuccinylase [Thalassobacillus cyri]|uniref:Succinyl-diaminopimelate desuccinylase n=1 Tax=Thalassobacillus cyri TaxID=571932 RepID=A0A1H3XVH0_9BACI|nr:ArgE/DapE family deacylase [Thalassobacillus cyri]SEA02508.1 succinyl-diaminopimelate desuccinylase [Thalassobacillus cyri]
MGDVTPLLEELIKIDSSTKAGVNKAVDFCEGWLKDQGLPVEKLENNGYHMLICELGQGERTVILNGHIDVIEAEEEQFQPYIEDGKMYGRGTADMKAGAAAMMMAMAQLKDEELSNKVQLQIVPDEETGGKNGTKFLTEQGYIGEFVICGEPTHLNIAIQSKGVLQLDMVIEGKPAHGSRPWEGKNAIVEAYSLFEQILKLPFAQETGPPMFGKPSINLAKIKGGSVYNKVPDKCEMSLDIRYLPDQSPDEVYKQIEEITNGQISTHIINDPVKTKEDNPYVVQLAQSLVNQTSVERANLYGQHGSNDGQFFTKYGASAVEFGPAGADWHGDNELVYIESVQSYKEVLVDFVLSQANKTLEKSR